MLLPNALDTAMSAKPCKTGAQHYWSINIDEHMMSTTQSLDPPFSPQVMRQESLENSCQQPQMSNRAGPCQRGDIREIPLRVHHLNIAMIAQNAYSLMYLPTACSTMKSTSKPIQHIDMQKVPTYHPLYLGLRQSGTV